MKRRELVSSKVGDSSLEPGAGAATLSRSLPGAAVSHLGVPPPMATLCHPARDGNRGVDTWGKSVLAPVALFLEMSRNVSW